MKTPTLTDVARAAGVSYATADRVLNGRAAVSARAAQKVLRAVDELGYVRNVAAANLSRQRTYRFVFIIPDGPNAFFRRMQGIVEDRARSLARSRVRVDILPTEAFDAGGLARRIATLAREELDGLAVVGIDTEDVVGALGHVAARNCPIVSLVSDLKFETRAAYVGIDNLAAGRTAARLAGLAHGGTSGLVLPIVGSLDARDHRDRLLGFREVLNADFANLTVLPPIEGRDDPRFIAKALHDTFALHPEITAIYSAGAGNRGLLDVVTGQERRPFCVLHELVAHSRAAILDGTCDAIIDQRPEEEVEQALRIMRALADGLPLPALPPILPTIYLRDNLPPAGPETPKGDTP